MGRRMVAGLALAVLAACGGAPGGGAGAGQSPQTASRELTAATWNLYVGFDPRLLAAATDAASLEQAAVQAFQNVQATNYQERVRTLGALLARQKPDLVGLQEAALFRTGPAGAPATGVLQDFLQLLLNELAHRGLVYVPVAVVESVDAQLPTPMGFDLRVTDRDVILARQGVVATDVQARAFADAVELPVPALGTALKVARGWVSVNARVNGADLRFVSTHLESDVAAVRLAQLAELAEELRAETLPTVWAGDFNLGDEPTGAGARSALGAAGWTDAWEATQPPGDPGFTCCQAPDLGNPVSELDRRIDYLFARGPVALEAAVLGDDPGIRQSTGRWPSDHAGVAARFRVP